LIETKPDFPLHRIAVEIHQMSERWALVNLSDLPSDILDSRESLEELGAVSLFIKNLESLSVEQQIRLAEYLATKPGMDMPHIIAGITALEEGAETQILPHLLDQFCHSQLDWTDRSPEEITRTFIAASLELLVETSRENLKSGQYYMPFHIRHLDPNHPIMH
jgi:Sigma-54 interaction domain